MKYDNIATVSTIATVQNDLKELQQYTSLLGTSIEIDEKTVEYQKQAINKLSSDVDCLIRRIQLFEDDYTEYLKQEVRDKMRHNQKLTQRDQIIKQWL